MNESYSMEMEEYKKAFSQSKRAINCVLKSEDCDRCIWSEQGFYNPVCAHCPKCKYSKSESAFMTREMAEMMGIITSGKADK